MRWRRREDEDAGSPSTPSGHTDTATAPAIAATDPVAAIPAARSATPSGHVGVIDAADLARVRRRAVARALAEDLGDAGDTTTAATVPPLLEGSARVVARADGVVAGVDVFREVLAQVDPRVEVEAHVADGDRVADGDDVVAVRGHLRSILTAERVALNFLCHLSGIATVTRRYVDAVGGTGVQVRDTRKTTPGLRLLEKAAVTAGGGVSHRIGLYDALLVKDNHVLAAGSAGRAARRALERSGGRHVQVEVAALDDLDGVLRAGVTDILLDNLAPDEVREAVRHVAGRAGLEVSGTITLDSIAAYAATGVDRISVGALTHSAPWLDLALDVDPLDPSVEAPPTWAGSDLLASGSSDDVGTWATEPPMWEDAEGTEDATSDAGHDPDTPPAARDVHDVGAAEETR